MRELMNIENVDDENLPIQKTSKAPCVWIRTSLDDEFKKEKGNMLLEEVSYPSSSIYVRRW